VPVVVTPPVRFLALLELADVWEGSRVEEVHERKELVEPVLNWRAGEDEDFGPRPSE
jgi:hypothetical protein